MLPIYSSDMNAFESFSSFFDTHRFPVSTSRLILFVNVITKLSISIEVAFFVRSPTLMALICRSKAHAFVSQRGARASVKNENCRNGNETQKLTQVEKAFQTFALI